ncbi:hypothetical protein QBC47DRAFT_111444 [Echria macrotheca]|uniref:Uncharacterized protein n=1 Tax=Echria macrotheca TaxID=438768 RepID=A0AAJ0BMK2_9PEZI|nr:hypothetical protein QBC47DRAFT_111444 [Echria macrotheca]
MQVVPSLVGTGTAVAAAAAGLVFGQPPESDAPRPMSMRGIPLGLETRSPLTGSRPGSSAVSPYPSPSEEFPYSSSRQGTEPSSGPLSSHPPGYYPPNASRTVRTGIQVSSPRESQRRQSFIRQGEAAPRPVTENARDSISSRDSWIRRLSIRPLSQHGSSPRSSVAPDSPSLFSHSSGAPMLGSGTAPPQQAPNKLVKRTPSGQQQPSQGTLSRRGSKSQMLTLRRPATSHQRSATLQQFQSQGGFSGPPPPGAKYSFDQQNAGREFVPRPMLEVPDPKQAPGTWTSFFHRKTSRSIGRRNAGPTSDSSPGTSTLPRKLVSIQLTSVPRAYLTKAYWIRGAKMPADEVEVVNEKPESRETSQEPSNPSESTDSTPSKRARRSISMHFSSPTSWISRTGSMRRPRRGTMDTKSGGSRQMSPPMADAPSPVQAVTKSTLEEIFTPPENRPPVETEAKPAARPQPRKRNSSSPLPPLNRISTFNLDISRIGLSNSSSATPTKHSQMPSNYTSSAHIYGTFPRSRGPSGERASTLASSDAEARDGLSGDDDTDFRSDGVFDSFRTVASSSRVRTVETPLESMFDESPPSTASNSKTKRLSIQEILGRSWDGETKITEEDESLPTPVRTGHLADPIEFERKDDKSDDFELDAVQVLSLANRDFGRPSIDDDDDEDWARDDDNTLSNHLSPPSSSTNSRRVSPTLRHALANFNGNTSNDLQRDLTTERPRSNIFDWAETPSHERIDADGHSARPKTVHGKQEMDLRGGRSATRKGPSAAHVRSQSVPVVPDPADASKAQPKFGTWGLSTKPASEEWDDDFEFEGGLEIKDGKDSATSFSMVVPASIQATQPTVKAHSGQIRELSLLVNDLKRLCRHGRDLNIMHEPLVPKWKEAENIIALASPDEDGDDDLDWGGQSTKRENEKDDRFPDKGFDSRLLDGSEDPFNIPEPEMGKTTVVRERQVVRRRSVFSPDDDIFGTSWPLTEESSRLTRPHTPEAPAPSPGRNSAISTVIEAMQQQRSISDPVKSLSPMKASDTKLFFDTNSLQELVKRAGHLRDALSEAVRRAELLTQSPAGTPRRERRPRHNPDGSPAFTQVFTDPASSPPRRLPKSHSNNSVLSRTSVDSPRMQLMTVN